MNILDIFLSKRDRRIKELANCYKRVKNTQLSEMEKMIVVSGECHMNNGTKFKNLKEYSLQYAQHAKELVQAVYNIKIDEVEIHKLIYEIIRWEYPNKNSITIESIRDANSTYNKSEQEINQSITKYL